ncbi:AMP-binding protein [Streptomyces nogalater]
MYPGWGMSETSAGVADCEFWAVNEGDDRYVPVGRPQPGTAVRVVDEHNRVVPTGTLGRLQVSGASVTAGYHRNEEQNRQSFTDGWFRTGDLAYVEKGVLTVTGRADDVIRVGDVTYHGHEIEARVEELGEVVPSYTVASQVTGAGGTEELAVFFHPRPGFDAAEVAARVRERVALTLGVRVAHAVPVGRKRSPRRVSASCVAPSCANGSKRRAVTAGPALRRGRRPDAP